MKTKHIILFIILVILIVIISIVLMRISNIKPINPTIDSGEKIVVTTPELLNRDINDITALRNKLEK